MFLKLICTVFVITLVMVEVSSEPKKIDKFPLAGSTTYVRWGRTVCDGEATELVYKGYAGGSLHTQKGGNTNYLCLPEDPEWSTYDDALINNGAQVYGAEYQFSDSHPILFKDQKIAKSWTVDAPCAVCRAPRHTSLMIPGKLTCPSGWKSEYSGYLVGGRHDFDSGSEFVCMDAEPEAVPGGDANRNGRLFYISEARCGSLKCPPYVNGREITCVVCSY